MTVENKHTPGPWRLDDPGHKLGHVSTLRIYADGGPTITSLFDSGPHCKPNARLIAAAPDLLAACDAMREWIVKATDDDDEAGYLNGDSKKHPGDGWDDLEKLDAQLATTIAKAAGSAS